MKLVGIVGRILIVVAVSLGAVLVVKPTPAAAAVVGIQAFDFNACDNYNSHSNPVCSGTTRAVRVARIVSSIQASGSNVVTLQETCTASAYEIATALGPNWSAYPYQTWPVSATRCPSGSWGIAVLANSSLTNLSVWGLPTYSDQEQRFLICGTAVISGAALKVCSTHFSIKEDAGIGVPSSQVAAARNHLNQFATVGDPVLLGADMNLNVKVCLEASHLAPFYAYAYGPPNCYLTTPPGTFYEADMPRSGGDGNYDAATQSDRKIDFVFVNNQRFTGGFSAYASSSNVSDHKILRASTPLLV